MENRQSSVDLTLLQKSQTTPSKPAIAQPNSRPLEDIVADSAHSFINQIEFASASSAARKRRKPVPKRKLGYQNSENGSRVSNDFCEDESRKTDSGSSNADDKHSLFSGINGAAANNGLFAMKGTSKDVRNQGGHQNFSYSNFHSFGANSPNQSSSENYPPLTKLLH